MSSNYSISDSHRPFQRPERNQLHRSVHRPLQSHLGGQPMGALQRGLHYAAAELIHVPLWGFV